MEKVFRTTKGLAARLNQFFKENRKIQIEKTTLEEGNLIVTYEKQKKRLTARRKFKRQYMAVELGKKWETGEEYAYESRFQLILISEFLSKEVHVAIYRILE